MRFCKDCKWLMLNRTQPLQFAKCLHPEIRKYNPVTGDPETFCSTERKDFGPATSKCGPDGNLFEPFEIVTVKVLP